MQDTVNIYFGNKNGIILCKPTCVLLCIGSWNLSQFYYRQCLGRFRQIVVTNSEKLLFSFSQIIHKWMKRHVCVIYVINNTSNVYTQWWIVIMQLYSKSHDFDSNVHVSLYSNLQSNLAQHSSECHKNIHVYIIHSLWINIHASVRLKIPLWTL